MPARSSSADFEPRIADYGLIGDCRSAALVSRYGSIDWLCWPRFDSTAVFAALLDRYRGGCWSIRPVTPTNRSPLGVPTVPASALPSPPVAGRWSYIEGTNVLVTRYVGESGEAQVTDLMPAFSEEHKSRHLVAEHEIIREVRCTSGEMEFELDFEPRRDYGRRAYRIRQHWAGYRVDAGRGVYWLRASHPLACDGSRVGGRFRLRAGQVAQFSLSYGRLSPVVLPPLGAELDHRIRHSVGWWRSWSSRIRYAGAYRAQVVRSALALKLMSYAPSGAIVAAPTTSLPETLGGARNWDYRYCWLRDASLTIRALAGLGVWDEAEAFLGWMLHATHMTQPRLRILYNVYGLNTPRERELRHLSGYAGSRPVRVGNGARGQVQLDIYGEVIEAASIYASHGAGFDRATQRVLRGFGEYVVKHWREPDEGIWEPRGGARPHTHSRLLCWVALDRLIGMGESGKLEDMPLERFRQERAKIAAEIRTRSWDARLGSYVNTIGEQRAPANAEAASAEGDAPDLLDSALLLLAWYGFEPAHGERMQATWRALAERLSPAPGLFYRYATDPPEGAFGVCSFWAAEFLAIGGGTLDEARADFEQLQNYANDLGLYAEEIDPKTGAALGNFPQAFTHIGHISAALAIEAREREGAPRKPQEPHHDERVPEPAVKAGEERG